MNQDILQGRWEQLKGKARIKWGKLTSDDIEPSRMSTIGWRRTTEQLSCGSCEVLL